MKLKNFNVKEIPLTELVVAGIIATVISFVYYFVLNNPWKLVYWLICLIDLALFTVSAYRVVECFDLSRVKTVFFTALTMIAFPTFCEIVVFSFTQGSRFEFTLDLFLSVLQVSLFLSPSFILLIPIMIFIAEIMS